MANCEIHTNTNTNTDVFQWTTSAADICGKYIFFLLQNNSNCRIMQEFRHAF